DHGQDVAVVIEEAARADGTRGNRRLPPEDSFAEPAGGFLHYSIHFLKKPSLALWCFWKGCSLLFCGVFRGLPVVGSLDDEDIFLVLLRHEMQVVPQIVQAAVPKQIIRLSDHIVWHVIRVELVEKVLGPFLVAAPVNVDHDARVWTVARPGSNAGDPSFE